MARLGKWDQASHPTPHEEAAAEVIARRHLRGALADEDAIVEKQIANDPLFADALRRAERASSAVDRYAGSPELVRFREQALARARRAHASRWRRSLFPSRPWQVAAALLGVA